MTKSKRTDEKKKKKILAKSNGTNRHNGENFKDLPKKLL